MAAAVQTLAFAADEFHGVNERWPTLAELLEFDDTLPVRDAWDHAFVFERTADGGLQVRSAGLDERLHTGDDIVSWVMHGGERYGERRALAERAAAAGRAAEDPGSR